MIEGGMVAITTTKAKPTWDIQLHKYYYTWCAVRWTDLRASVGNLPLMGFEGALQLYLGNFLTCGVVAYSTVNESKRRRNEYIRANNARRTNTIHCL